MIKGILWSTMLDYPNEIATTLFFGVCRWNCEFCYNRRMFEERIRDFDSEIFPKLVKRKEFINHIVLSGGECTDSSTITSIVDKLYNAGFHIGIHTNGSNPRVLEEILPRIDYIGMDIKTTVDRYRNLIRHDIDYSNIIESIKMVLDSGKKYEFRTTLYPRFVLKEDCVKIAQLLSVMGADKYILQQYKNEESEIKIEPYRYEDILDIIKKCNKYILTTVRGD